MSSRPLLEAAFWLFGSAATVLSIYASGGILFPFLLATRRLRLRVAKTRVVLSGIDPGAMAVSGLTIGIFPAILAPFGSGGAWVGVLVGAVVCFGCRLRVHATPTQTTVVRTVCFVVPWCWRSYASPPSAFVDGWGDYCDPKSLQLAFYGEEEPLELGWGGDPGPACDALAARINEAMAALQR
jgi:hypothetical protein